MSQKTPMDLVSGKRLGAFEVLGPLGAGGMGQVYRARDTRLNREVAIKILPEAFADDATRVARFEREARLLASVNHPTVAAIFGAEESGSFRYIVMELVPGETLGERLVRGALPLEEALRLSRQIAEALEAAHERGVVHRDLKPANIKITPEEKVKVLDLGLAKAMDLKAEGDDLSDSPTAVLDQTRPGVILGTAEFMSPEQARGKPVDKRADIWSFGCVLFEMLSGRRAFTGETVSDVLASILASDPPWEALPSGTPPRIRQLLSRCLQKDANQRLRDIGDARIEIDQTLAEEQTPVRTGFSAAPRRRGVWIAVFSTLAVLAAAAIWFSRRSPLPLAEPLPNQKVLAVLPFRDLSNQPGGQLMGDGLVETVSVRLGNIPGIQIVTPNATVQAWDKNSDSFIVARGLGANLFLKGAFQREGDVLRITYSILDTFQGRIVASDTVEGSASDVFGLQDRVAESITERLKLPRSGAPATPSGLETASQQDRYLQALGHLQRYDKPASVDEAIRLLEGLAAEKPLSPLAQAALARAYLYKYNLTREKAWADRAAASTGRARQLAPDLPEVYVTLGELNVRTGNPQEAVSAFQRALSGQPNNIDALLGLARALDASEKVAEAEATYRKAIQFQPSYWAGYSKFGGFYFTHGRFESAAQMFRRVTVLAPDNSRAFGNLGASYQLMGDFDKALASYEKSLELERTDLAYSNIGTLQFVLGRYRESAEAFEKALELTPGKFQLWAHLGDAYRWTPEWKTKAAAAYRRAIALCRDELRVNPREGSALSYLGMCLAKTGSFAAAEQEILRALETAPTNPQFLYHAAIVASLAGKSDQALDRIRRSAAAGYSRKILAGEPEFASLRDHKLFQESTRVSP